MWHLSDNIYELIQLQESQLKIPTLTKVKRKHFMLFLRVESSELANAVQGGSTAWVYGWIPVVCDLSNESYWAVLSSGSVYFAVEGDSQFWFCGWNP